MAAIVSNSVLHVGQRSQQNSIPQLDGSVALRMSRNLGPTGKVSSKTDPSSLPASHGRQRHLSHTRASGSSAGSTIPDHASEKKRARPATSSPATSAHATSSHATSASLWGVWVQWVDSQRPHSVADIMARGDLITATESTTVDEALEALVDNRITGMPVVDKEGRLVGVVSDYDLLALDSISGKPAEETGMFPQAGSTWKAFKEIRKLLLKTRGRTVGEVMTPSPLVVRPMTNLEDAARLLLESKYRRLPVVDDTGRLVGLLTRGNVVRAALEMKRAEEGRHASNS